MHKENTGQNIINCLLVEWAKHQTLPSAVLNNKGYMHWSNIRHKMLQVNYQLHSSQSTNLHDKTWRNNGGDTKLHKGT